MIAHQASRSRELLELGRDGIRSIIKALVKESVREVLVEERLAVVDQDAHTRQPDEGERPETGNGTGTGKRRRRPMLLLPVLGLAAAGVIVGRRRLKKAADESDVIDRTGESALKKVVNRRPTVGSDPPQTDDSTSHGAHDGDADRDGPTDHGATTGDDDARSTTG